MNAGVVGQFPYFAPDTAYLKKAPKMTSADAEYLRRYMQIAKEKEIANVEDTFVGVKDKLKPEDESEEEDINPRLKATRINNQPDGKTMTDIEGNPVTLTDAIFEEKKFFGTKEDTTEDPKMHDFVKNDWQSSAFEPKKKKKRFQDCPRGPAGNIVPFFPTDWNKNSNLMFNSSLFMDKFHPDEIVEYNENKHAAIYRKPLNNPVNNKLTSLMAAQKKDKDEQVDGTRPTSGKHYARCHSGIRRKRQGHPPTDPATSNVAKHYEKTRKVETLMNRLAEYMAGDIPEADDLDQIFSPEEKQEKDLDKGPLEPEENIKEVNEVEPIDINVSMVDEDESKAMNMEVDAKYQYPAKRRYLKPATEKKPKKNEEHLFIYKDFDTTLTKVGGNKNMHPAVDLTTSIRGEDLIRDRLLSFKYRNGSLQNTIDEEKNRVKRKKVVEYAQMKVG